MEIGKIEVSGNRARVSSRSSVTSGMVGATVAFAFDETWADMDKTLVWAGSGVTVDDTTASGVVPAEVVAKFGGRLKVGVYGTKEGTAIPTVWADLGPILPGADPSGDESTDPSLPVWAQLQQQMGISPVVAVEDIDGGHRVTITDKDGEKTFDVMDGEDGAVTEEQIASAVEDYMAEHPVEVTDIVKTVNGISPDENGNVEIPVSGGNADFQVGETLKLENGILSVNTTNNMEQDNTLPITSAGVFATVGNIEALLKTI